MSYTEKLAKFNLLKLILISPYFPLFAIYREFVGKAYNISFFVLIILSIYYLYIFFSKNHTIFIFNICNFEFKSITIRLLYLSIGLFFLGALIMHNIYDFIGIMVVIFGFFILAFTELVTLFWKPDVNQTDQIDMN